jgi:hypothetical protein
MLKTGFKYIIALIAFLLIFTSCASENQAIDLAEIADNDSNTGDGGSFYPDASGSTNICDEDEEGDCIDEATISSIMLNNQQLEFDMSEIDDVECQSLGLPSGVSFEAEVDQDNTSLVDGAYQFTVLNASGGYSEGRVTGSGDITICYMRTGIGTHSGQVKVLLNASSTSSSAYAYIIKTSGQTLAPLFSITSPTEGLIIDGRDGHHEGVDSAEGDYLLTVSGTLNLDLQTIFENGLNSDLYIEADGVKYKTTFNEGGSFSKQVGVPQVEGIYAVTVSLNTNRDSVISKTISVVVAGPPELIIEVRDPSETEIDTTAPTDMPYLIVGLRISNLATSGSSQTEMPVTLSEIAFNGEELHPDSSIWYDEAWSWCESEELTSTDTKGFTGVNTLCIPLSHITELQDGVNTITAKATNALGESSTSYTLIIDNDKPIITVTSPDQNQLYAPGQTKIVVSGKVKYFAPLDSELASSKPVAQGSDVGSYCQPDEEDDADCPESSVKMWFNVSTSFDNYPIYIYPEYTDSYSSVSSEQQEEYMEGESAQHGNCYTQLTTEENDDGTETTEENTVCDVPEGEFKITLTVPSLEHHAHVNLYTNVIELQAESVKGHRTIEVVTFQVGETSSHKRSYRRGQASMTSTLTSGQLGLVETSCGVTEEVCVNRAPVMLNVSEGLINRESEEGAKIIKVVEHYLNENLSFADVANGWMNWPKDDDDNIALEEDFQKQWLESSDSAGERYDDFKDLPNSWKEKFIQQALHSNVMAMKFWAWVRYIDYLQDTEDSDCDLHPEQCYFEREGDPEEEYNVALDKCGEVITSSFVPIGDFIRVAENFKDYDINRIRLWPEWPDIAGTDFEYNDFVTGKWVVQSLNLKANGYVDADVCVVPDDEDLYDSYLLNGCDANVASATVPAFWGHFVSYNLVEGGLLGENSPLPINDDTIPMVWSVGKIRLTFEDVIQVTKEKIGDVWANKVNIFEDNIKIIQWDELDDLFSSSAMGTKSVQVEPFANCPAYYAEQHPGYEIPFGCSNNDASNYPFVLELNSTKGQDVYIGLMDNGASSYMLGVVWQGVIETFKKMVGCMDTEMVNPMISSHYDYPSWVWEGGAMSLDFEWEEFNFSANIENSDLNIFDGGITARVPLSLGVDGVPMTSFINFLTAPTGLNFGNMSKLESLTVGSEANTKGHLVRSSQNNLLEGYPLTSSSPQTEAFLGLSINLEEIVNAASYLVFKKGPLSLLETFEVDELEKNTNWSLGVDKVILGRFDICNIAGLIGSELAPSLFFATSQSLFNESSLHLDVILDSDYPVTISLNPIEGAGSNATEIQLGVSNLQIGVKELMAHVRNDEVQANVYDDPKEQEELLRLRLDGVIKVRAVYYKELRQIHIYLPSFAEQNVHASLVPGRGGPTYDDVNVVTDVLNGVIAAVFDKMGKNIYEDFNDEGELDPAEANPTLVVTLKGDDQYGAGSFNVGNLEDFEFELKVDAAENASCGDNVAYYSDEVDFPQRPNIMNGPKSKSVQTAVLKSSSSSLPDMGDLQPISVGLGKDFTTHMWNDPCKFLYPGKLVKEDDGTFTREEDVIRETLCDFGIKDIVIDPVIEFDNDEGYIHVSADLFIELENWLLDD